MASPTAVVGVVTASTTTAAVNNNEETGQDQKHRHVS